MSERVVVDIFFLVASIAVLAAVALVYFAWRTREKCDFAFNTALPENSASRSLSQDRKNRH
jgi:hypothetical protein